MLSNAGVNQDFLTMATAVIYARVSSTGERQSTSRQVADLTDYAIRNGLEVLKVVSIHDAIVVLDTQENEGLEPMAIKRIINDVYRDVLLHPTVHIDEFPLPTV